MKLDVYFTPAELAGVELPERVVVVDVLRATSTIVAAFANGARAVFPVGTVDEAARIAQSIGRDSVLLCGERKGVAIEGFDLGNAPAEFTRERVEDLSLVMTTTNGTRALLAVAERAAKSEGNAEIVAGAFLNLSAVTRWLRRRGQAAAIVCAGREGRFALEDAVYAGALCAGVAKGKTRVEMNDAAVAARALAGRHMRSLRRMFERTAAGRQLVSIGHAEDLDACSELDRTDAIPHLRDRKMSLE